jgi:hypothetical protein
MTSGVRADFSAPPRGVPGQQRVSTRFGGPALGPTRVAQVMLGMTRSSLCHPLDHRSPLFLPSTLSRSAAWLWQVPRIRVAAADDYLQVTRIVSKSIDAPDSCRLNWGIRERARNLVRTLERAVGNRSPETLSCPSHGTVL